MHASMRCDDTRCRAVACLRRQRWPALPPAWLLALLGAIWIALGSTPASAHQASDAYLQLRVEPTQVTLRWDIALRDLDVELALDADDDGRLTWGEVRQAWPAIEAHAAQRFALEGCAFAADPAGGPALEQRSDGAYAVLRWQADCSLAAGAAGGALPGLQYSLMRDVDPMHRGLLKVERPGQGVSLQVLDPQAPAVASGSSPAAASAAGFVREGVHHIVTGYDHLLFLMCLLLPAVMRRTPQGWAPVATLREGLWPVLGVVTAFTLAHSLTLALAALGGVSLPGWIIEPAIAATIVVAALDNLRPVFGRHRVLVTFAFGLIHGFGFAGVLAELELPPAHFAWALLQFNVGLELGQLAIVLVAVAALYALRRAQAYPRWVIGGGSVAAMAMGAVWLAERTVGLGWPGGAA